MCSLNDFCALCEVRGFSFVDGGAGIGDESEVYAVSDDDGEDGEFYFFFPIFECYCVGELYAIPFVVVVVVVR